MQQIFRVFSGVAVLTLLLLPATVHAQSLDSPYRYIPERQHAGVFVGYLVPSEGRLGTGPNSGVGFGGRWGIEIAGPLALDVEAMYAPLTRPVVDTARTADGYTVVGEADMNMALALASVRFNVTGQRTWHGFQPFLLLGAGAAFDLSGANGDDEDIAGDVRSEFGTSFAGQLGAGFEWFALPQLAVRLDGGAVLWKLKTPPAFRAQQSVDEEAFPASEWERNFKATAGISFHF